MGLCGDHAMQAVLGPEHMQSADELYCAKFTADADMIVNLELDLDRGSSHD